MTTVDSSAVEALGWALVHFAWQGALAGVLFAVLDLGLRGSSPRLRYALGASTLAVMALMPPLTFLATRTAARETPPPAPGLVLVRASAAAAAVAETAPASSDRTADPMRQRISSSLPAIVGLWCAGVLVFSIRYLGGWRLVRRMDRSARPVAAGEISDRLASLARRMRVTRPVRLLESAIVEVPTVVGWLRPAILMPVATMAGLTAEQLEAVLAHELAHIRRQDYLVGLLQSAVETVLFYQPAVWWVSHRMRVERELCCDDEAVAACGNPVQYARALADLEAARPAPLLAQAATGGPLFERIARLVAPSGHAVRVSRGAAAALALAAIAVAGTGVTSLRAGAVAGQSAGESPEAKGRTPVSGARPVAPAEPSPRPRRTEAPAPKAPSPRDTRPVPIERVIELAGAGVTPEYIDDLAALGYPTLSWDQLIAMRSQGVSAEFIRGLAEAGHAKLTPDQLTALRSQGVTPEFVRELASEGLKDLSMSDLVALRSQGVSADYVRGLRSAGHTGLSVTDLVGARSQGVSTEDASALKTMGYTDLSLGRLVSLRSQGVSAQYVRELQAEGYNGLSVPVLIGLRSQGVTVEYVRELKQLGYSGLSAGELIELRSQGVTPEFVREIKDAGYDRLTPKELIELRSHDVDPELLRRIKAREGTR
jgi:beta-lactamase regulating signal transducer with metallopeptidase domain